MRFSAVSTEAHAPLRELKGDLPGVLPRTGTHPTHAAWLSVSPCCCKTPNIPRTEGAETHTHSSVPSKRG